MSIIRRLGVGRRRRFCWMLAGGISTLVLYVAYHRYTTVMDDVERRRDRIDILPARPLRADALDDRDTYEVPIPPPARGVVHRPPTAAVNKEAPGEGGTAVHVKDTTLVEESMRQWFMNVHASDRISLDRSVSDQRSADCRRLDYAKSDLPHASVVVIFTDEAWSALLRTIHSIVNRTPRELLAEIVLVDDFSQREELKDQLVEYLRRFDGLVRLIRARRRLGLIRAKIVGGQFARGDVLVFLDSHCEATEGWIEPLLARIHEKRTAIVCPVIDVIDDRTMEYMGGSLAGIGTFWWSLHYKMDGIPERERLRRKNPGTDYLNSPTMAGGLFAVERAYFFEVGAYDDGMDIWGGENLEISFRVWMCGGSIEILPCSHVGHIYRNGHPYNMTGRGGNLDVHGTNSKRLAEVWMDDYKRLFYVQRMGLKDSDDFIGDLSERKALRERLKCHSFKWFLDNVIPEKFIPDENVQAYGLVKNTNGKLCLDTLQRNDNKGTIFMGVFDCQMSGSSSQTLSWSREGELRRETTCLDAAHEPPAGSGGAAAAPQLRDGRLVRKAVMRECDARNLSPVQHVKNGAIRHIGTNLCLDVVGLLSGDDVLLAQCDDESPTQRWTIVGTYFQIK